MTTSGTYTFGLDNSQIVCEAFARLGVHATAITRQHLIQATRSLNLAFAAWANRGVNLWKVELITIPLVQGTTTYNLPANLVNILDAYLEFDDLIEGTEPIDRILNPISRTDYAALPNKGIEGTPTVYWYDRLAPISTVTIWQVPDGNGPYTFNAYGMKRIQDAGIANGETPDIPYRFLDAICADLAKRLARKFAPQLVVELTQEAAASWAEASTEDRERVQTFIAPDTSGYFRI